MESVYTFCETAAVAALYKAQAQQIGRTKQASALPPDNQNGHMKFCAIDFELSGKERENCAQTGGSDKTDATNGWRKLRCFVIYYVNA
jgi:hypothetical protein